MYESGDELNWTVQKIKIERSFANFSGYKSGSVIPLPTIADRGTEKYFLRNHWKEANAIVQQFNNIQNPKGEAIMGHLIRGTEETKLTSAGGLLDPNGQPILGPKPSPGCLLDQNGKPIKPYLSKSTG